MQCIRLQLTNVWRFTLRKTYQAFPARKIEDAAKCISNFESFKEELKNNLDSDSNYLIFSEDLKKLLKVAETDDDLLLVEKVLSRFYSQSDNLRFQDFNFGPEVMRLYYVNNKPVEALSLFKKEEFSLIFNAFSSYVLLLDLLFKNLMYEEVTMVFHIFFDKIGQTKKFPSSICVLFFGACYKLNTSEKYMEAQNVWESLQKNNYVCPFRGKLFFGMLALLQGQYTPVIEIFDGDLRSIPWNIRLMALVKSKRYNYALEELKNFYYQDKPREQKRNLHMETLECLEKEFKKSNEQNNEFQELKEKIIIRSMPCKQSLDELLCEEVNIKPSNTYKINQQKIKN